MQNDGQVQHYASGLSRVYKVAFNAASGEVAPVVGEAGVGDGCA